METKRLFYIDWLRVLVILSLIPFHAALTYTRYGVVPIKAPVSGLAALPFLAVSVPLGDFFMTLLFFISGMASFYSFKSRDSGNYIQERRNKLLFPFLLGWFLFLCPATGYVQALYEGYTGGFLNFIPQFFWYQSFHYNGYGHLWFLLYLYVFSLLCVPLFNLWKKEESRIERIGAFFSKGQRLLLPIGFIVLLELCLRPFFHPDAYIILFDWANDAVYLSLFIFGYVFASDERIQEKIKEYYNPSKVFGLLSLATLFFVNIQSQMLYSNETYLGVLWVIAKGVYECSAIIFLLNFARTRLNKGGRAVRYLSKASFTYYIFHYLPVTFFTFLFINLKIHLFLKFLLVILLSYITVFLVYEFRRRVGGNSGPKE
jgi:hypothetical protein